MTVQKSTSENPAVKPAAFAGLKPSERFPELKNILSSPAPTESMTREEAVSEDLPDLNDLAEFVEDTIPIIDTSKEIPGTAPAPTKENFFKYEEDGKEIELPAEEVRKKLSSAQKDGEEAKKYKSLLAEKNKEMEVLSKKAALLDKLEKIKHDEDALIKLITGEDPETFKLRAAEKHRIKKTGSAEEKSALEREERIDRLEKELASRKQRDDELAESLKSQEKQAEYNQALDLVRNEFLKNKLDSGTEEESIKINKYLWNDGRERMKEYIKKYKDHPKYLANKKEMNAKFAERAFMEAAKDLKEITVGQVTKQADKVIEDKKKKALESAQASVSKGSGAKTLDMADFKGKSPREIAALLTGNKKFSIF